MIGFKALMIAYIRTQVLNIFKVVWSKGNDETVAMLRIDKIVLSLLSRNLRVLLVLDIRYQWLIPESNNGR